MCGISGICHSDLHLHIDSDLIRKMTRSMAHRGPDGEGYFEKPGVALGHRRLSIIDIEGGDQPMLLRDETCTIVFNGEIYNYIELRKELEDRGYRFRTESDTEVVLTLYRDKGKGCVDYLNGMFAFAIWDDRSKNLFLARDRLGQKPLYYSIVNGTLVFGSELKSLLEYPDINAEIDASSVDDYLAYGYVPCPKTIYSGIAKLAPGNTMTWQNGAMSTDVYWSPEREPTNRYSITFEDATSELDALIRDSIRLCLRSDVPVGMFLSGGIDSSLIATMAAAESGTKPSTYTIRFNESEKDESEYAQLTAQAIGTDHQEILVTDFGLEQVPALASQFDEPFADPSSLPTYFLTREAARYVKVCLSGDAGDELFGGYRRYLPEPFENIMTTIPSSFRRSFLAPLARAYPQHRAGKGWLERITACGAAKYQLTNGVFSPDERAFVYRNDFKQNVDTNTRNFKPAFEGSSDRNYAERCLYADQTTYLPDDILVKVDRMSMMNSLEVRVPLLDHRIVEFANRLPYRFKIENGQQKRVLRAVAEKVLPKTIIDRPKQGFGLPLKEWFGPGQNTSTKEHVLSKNAPVAQYFDRESIHKLIAVHESGKRDYGAKLWSIFWLNCWLQGS